MTGKRKQVVASILAAAAAGVAADLRAATMTWDGGVSGTGASWGTAANWVNDTPPASGDSITFNATDYAAGGGSTWTLNSNVVTLQNGNSAIQIGQTITGGAAGIPGGTTIVGIASDFRTLTVSAVATASGTNNINVLGVGGLVGGPTIALDANRSIDTLNLNNSTAFALGSATENAGGRYTLSLSNVTRGTTTGMTINANVNLVANVTGRSTWRDSSSGTTTVTGSVGSTGAVVLDKGGSSGGTVIMNGANTFTGSIVVDTGTLTFGGSNAYTGSSTASGGTLGLNFNSGVAGNSDIINSGSALVLGGVRGGGTLSVTGKTATSVSQTFASTTIAAGASALSIANGNTANTRTLVNLGALAHMAGGTVNIVQPTGTGNTTVGSTNGFTTSTANDASGILGAYATVAGTDWAANDGTNIVAYTGYTDLAGATPSLSTNTAANVRITSGSTGDIGQGAGTVTINTLRVSDNTLRTVTVGTGNTLRLNGILSTGTNGITLGAAGNAGSITAGLADDTAGELILNNSTGVVINSAIVNNGTGAVAFTKAGAGTATITSANTYTGVTYVTGGTLSLASGASLASGGNMVLTGGALNLGGNTVSIGSGQLTVAGGSLANGVLDQTGGTISALSGVVSAKLQGTAGLYKTSSGTLTFTNTVSNSYSGDTVIEEGAVIGSTTTTGALAISGNLTVGSVNGGNSASFAIGITNGVQWNANKNLTIYRNGSVNLGGAAYTFGNNANVTVLGVLSGSQMYGSGNWNIQGGTINGGFYGNSRTFNHTGDVTSIINASGGGISMTFSVADGTPDVDLIFNGGISNPSGGTAGLTKSGNGLMTSTANQGYTGVTALNGGTLRVTSMTNGTVNSPIGAASVAASNLVFGGGALQYTGAGSSTDRLFTISTGTAGTIDASGAGALNFTSNGNVAYGTTNQARTLTLTGTSTADNTMSLTIGNNGSSAVNVNKTGSGKWILAGTNSYTGVTSVTAGTLLVTGTQGTGNVSVNGATAVFGGTGTISGNTTITSGKLAAGNGGVGTLTLNGNVTIAGALAVELDGTGAGSADKIVVTTAGKTLDITNATLDVSVVNPLNDDAYVIASYNQLAGTFANITGLNGFQSVDYNYLGSNQIAVVPEPATAGLAVLGLGAMLTRRRRRVR